MAEAEPYESNSSGFNKEEDAEHEEVGIGMVHDGVLAAEPSLRFTFKLKAMLAYLGPGFLVCIAYLDPGNLEADLQTGAYTNYQLLWVLLLAHAMGLLLQVLAARLGVATGAHMAYIARHVYPRPAHLTLWAIIELAIIGSDVQEVLGSAIALQLLLGLPLWAGCLLTALDTVLFLGMHVCGVRKLEAFFAALVATMTAAFVFNMSVASPPASEVMAGFIPRFSMNQSTMVVALGLMGAVIMPHNLYLHSALVLSRPIDRKSLREVMDATVYYTVDSAFALFVAFFINLAVVATFAFKFYDPICAVTIPPTACLEGIYDSMSATGGYLLCGDGEGTCQPVGMSNAGHALESALGGFAKYVWAIGLLAAGQSSTMAGTYAGQFVMEGFLNLKMAKYQRVLLTRVVALGPALLVVLSVHNKPGLSDRVSEWINVAQSLQLPFAVLPLLHMCNSSSIMGKVKVGPKLLGLSWAVGLTIIAANITLAVEFMKPKDGGLSGGATVVAVFFGLGYLALCLYFMHWDLIKCWRFLLRITGYGNHMEYAWDDESDSSETGSELVDLVLHEGGPGGAEVNRTRAPEEL